VIRRGDNANVGKIVLQRIEHAACFRNGPAEGLVPSNAVIAGQRQSPIDLRDEILDEYQGPQRGRRIGVDRRQRDNLRLAGRHRSRCGSRAQRENRGAERCLQPFDH